MDSSSKAELVVLFHNGKPSVPLRIILNKIGYPQPSTLIKTDNSTAMVPDNVRQKSSKEMDMRFYWMKGRVKQTGFCILETGMSKHGWLLHKTSPTTSPYIIAVYLHMNVKLLAK